MTARILVVDDIEMNLRLLEARLQAEYYEVVTATSGADALAICRQQTVDLVLLDVMMPDMDGYEVCRRLKADPGTAHLPVVLITALDEVSDRLTGLEAGADDFLTKPVRDLPLFSRVKSLTRLKLTTDELRRRAQTAFDLMAAGPGQADTAAAGPIRIAGFADDGRDWGKLQRALRAEAEIRGSEDPADVLQMAASGAADLVLVDLAATRHDPLRLISQLRSNPATRPVPIVALAPAGEERIAAKALELGANDYIQRPVDRNELLVRMRTQLRRRHQEERLRRSLDETLELAVSDPLTGLHNRRFLESHLAQTVERARRQRTPFSLLVADIDHFKRINDGFGHDAGDRVLREFARRLGRAVRASDLACRFGGEEFAVLMAGADEATAMVVADRIRRSVFETPFDVGGEEIIVTVSAGLAVFDPDTDDASSVFRRADQALYGAKRGGRNRVATQAAA